MKKPLARLTSLTLGLLLGLLATSLRAEDRPIVRTFSNKSNQRWTILICPRPASVAKNDETGTMIFRDASDASKKILATLGENCSTNNFVLQPKKDYQVEFTTGSMGRFFHYFTLIDKANENNNKYSEGFIGIDYGLTDMAKGADKVILRPFDARSFNIHKRAANGFEFDEPIVSLNGVDLSADAVAKEKRQDRDMAIRLEIMKDSMNPNAK